MSGQGRVEIEAGAGVRGLGRRDHDGRNPGSGTFCSTGGLCGHIAAFHRWGKGSIAVHHMLAGIVCGQCQGKISVEAIQQLT